MTTLPHPECEEGHVSESQQRAIGELLYEMARWMQQAERNMIFEAYRIGPFVGEGRLLREWAERIAKDELDYPFPQGVR